MTAAGGHLTAAELARLELPGLPRTKRGVLFLAEKQGWRWQERPGRGGAARAFAVADLPEPARALLEQRRRTPAPANLRPVGRPKGSDFFTRHPDVADAVEVILAERDLSATRILELLAQRFEALPSRRTLSRFVARLEEEKKALLASTRDPDLFKGRYRLALGRADGALTRANQRWEIDTTKADVLTKGGRRCILGLVDVWSRRARFLVVKSESAQSVRRLLVTTIQAWGVLPEEVGTDNGSGFVNASLETALPALGIRQWRCAPGSPEKKPFVERLFGTFTRERAALLPGFAGHNVAQAQRLRGKAKKETGRAEIVAELEPEQLQQILDNWTEGVYGQRRHGTTGQPPIARWASSPSPSARAPSDDALKIALSRHEGSAVVGKRGIQWRRGRYWAPALAAWMGRSVMIRRDEEDLGALFVFDEDGRFIDTAVDHRRAGLSEEAFSRAAARQQAEWLKEQKAEIRAKRSRFSIEDAREQLLRDDARRAGQLALFPTQTVERPTPQMESIAARPAPPAPDPAALEAALARTAPTRRPEQSITEKVAATDAILQAAQRGEVVDEAELRRARLFAGSTAYRAQKVVEGDFAVVRRPDPTAVQRRQSA